MSEAHLTDTGKHVLQIARRVAQETIYSPAAIAPVGARGLKLGVDAGELESLLMQYGPNTTGDYLSALERSKAMQIALTQFGEAMQIAARSMMAQIGPMIAQLYHQLVDAGWIEEKKEGDDEH